MVRASSMACNGDLILGIYPFNFLNRYLLTDFKSYKVLIQDRNIIYFCSCLTFPLFLLSNFSFIDGYDMCRC